MTQASGFYLKNRLITQRRLAENLFVCQDFAMIKFRDMELEDWKIHASRAWEIAGEFIKETERQERRKNNKSAPPKGRASEPGS